MEVVYHVRVVGQGTTEPLLNWKLSMSRKKKSAPWAGEKRKEN